MIGFATHPEPDGVLVPFRRALEFDLRHFEQRRPSRAPRGRAGGGGGVASEGSDGGGGEGLGVHGRRCVPLPHRGVGCGWGWRVARRYAGPGPPRHGGRAADGRPARSGGCDAGRQARRRRRREAKGGGALEFGRARARVRAVRRRAGRHACRAPRRAACGRRRSPSSASGGCGASSLARSQPPARSLADTLSERQHGGDVAASGRADAPKSRRSERVAAATSCRTHAHSKETVALEAPLAACGAAARAEPNAGADSPAQGPAATCC